MGFLAFDPLKQQAKFCMYIYLVGRVHVESLADPLSGTALVIGPFLFGGRKPLGFFHAKDLFPQGENATACACELYHRPVGVSVWPGIRMFGGNMWAEGRQL